MCFKRTPTHQTTAATTDQKRSSGVSDRDLCTSCRELGLSTYLWLHCRKQTLICWWSYYVAVKHCSFTEAVQYFLNCWLKYSKFKFFIKKRKTKEWDQSPTQLCSKSCHLQDQRTQRVSVYKFLMPNTWLWKAKSFQTDGIWHKNQWIVCILKIYTLNTSVASVE